MTTNNLKVVVLTQTTCQLNPERRSTLAECTKHLYSTYRRCFYAQIKRIHPRASRTYCIVTCSSEGSMLRHPVTNPFQADGHFTTEYLSGICRTSIHMTYRRNKQNPCISWETREDTFTLWTWRNIGMSQRNHEAARGPGALSHESCLKRIWVAR